MREPRLFPISMMCEPFLSLTLASSGNMKAMIMVANMQAAKITALIFGKVVLLFMMMGSKLEIWIIRTKMFEDDNWISCGGVDDLHAFHCSFLADEELVIG